MMLSKLNLNIRSAKGLCGLFSRHFSNMQDSYYSEEHKAIQNTLRKIIDTDINPNVDQWENDGEYPAHEVFKKLGNAGLMGVTKPVEYGGSGLDFSYSLAFNEALGHVNCGAIPMSVAVQTDMSTPALAK